MAVFSCCIVAFKLEAFFTRVLLFFCNYYQSLVRRSLGNVALLDGVSVVALHARAHGYVPPRTAFRIDPALTSTGILAFEINASSGIWTVAVFCAFALLATGQRISDVARMARADWTFVVGTIVAWFAPGIGSARIGFAQITFLERPAADERIAGHVLGARADGRQSSEPAVGPDAADVVAGILADAVEAGRSAGRAVDVPVAFRLAAHGRVAEVVLGALADRPVVHDVALCVRAALGAGVLTSEFDTSRSRAAFVVGFAFVPASRQRLAVIARLAFASGRTVYDLAKGVGAARAGMAQFRWIEPSAPADRVPGEPGRAGAHGDVVPGDALGVGAASPVARVDAAAVPAGQVAPALGIVQAFGPLAVGDGIAQVSAEAGAHGASSYDGALGVLAASVSGTGRHVGHGSKAPA